jgi:hypothetical protein
MPIYHEKLSTLDVRHIDVVAELVLKSELQGVGVPAVPSASAILNANLDHVCKGCGGKLVKLVE